MDESELATTSAEIPTRKNPRLTFWAGVVLVALFIPEAVLLYARFGNPQNMPDPLARLALKVRNPRVPREIPIGWLLLCRAWDTWLGNLQSNAPRLLRTKDLWAPDDPLQSALADFIPMAGELRPESIVPVAAVEKRLSMLGQSPPAAVLAELRLSRVNDRVNQAMARVQVLAVRLETWPRWEQLRQLLKDLEAGGFTRAAAALRPRLPPLRSSPGFKVNTVRTLKLLYDASLDETGMLPLLGRWNEWTNLAKDLAASDDPVLKAAPSQALAGLVDRSSLSEFADSLAAPLEELRRLHRRLPDSAVRRDGALLPVK